MIGGMPVGPMTVEEHVACVSRACPVNGMCSGSVLG